MVTAADDTREYAITPALIDAVDRECGEITHRLMARDLDISPLVTGIILQCSGL